ncbi:MAG: imidazole glycerol phosphate synthase subunit HisH [Bacteroidota bacterium]
MKVVIIKYNAGNVQSVLYALERLGIHASLSDAPEVIHSADKVIFPGVGEAGTAMHYLRERKLDQVLVSLTQPVLGVCLGMQLMCTHSEEKDTPCLGIFDHKVRLFPQKSEKVPHMGWNTLITSDHALWQGLEPDPHVYFVHSYYVDQGPYTIAETDYILPYSAALHRDNYYATQFHPEKSGTVGARILENFLKLT